MSVVERERQRQRQGERERGRHAEREKDEVGRSGGRTLPWTRADPCIKREVCMTGHTVQCLDRSHSPTVHSVNTFHVYTMYDSKLPDLRSKHTQTHIQASIHAGCERHYTNQIKRI